MMPKTKRQVGALIKPRSAGEALAQLSVARRMLAQAVNVPDIDDLIVHAEAVRAAAKILGCSVPGMNAWTRFKIDAQRKGHHRIVAMRKAGELVEQSGRPKNPPEGGGLLILSDLISRRAWQRAAEWARLALLDDVEIEEIFETANRNLKLVAEGTLIKLGATKETRKRRDASRGAEPLPDGMDFRLGDCRTVLADVEDNSIALILTDPPYGDDAEPLFQWLGEWAKRVLIPGGSLICFTGHTRLDRDIRIFGDHLRYWWLLALVHKQPQRFPGRFVIAGFKPVLWFVKQKRRGKTLISDFLRDDGRDKEQHDWSQGDAGVGQLIEGLTEPGEVIADPFAGSRLWGKISVAMGRRWIGSDIVDGGDTAVFAAVEAAE